MCLKMYTFTGLLFSDYRYILIAKYPQQEERKKNPCIQTETIIFKKHHKKFIFCKDNLV